MTLVDYSLSDFTFDKLDALKDSIAEIASTCNQTDNMLTSLLPGLNEFSYVARSKITFLYTDQKTNRQKWID